MALATLYVSRWEAIGLGFYFVMSGLALLKWWRPIARWMGRNWTWGASERSIQFWYGTQDDPKRWFMRVWGWGCIAAGLLSIIVGIFDSPASPT